MQFTKKRPEAIRVPVKLTEDKYELWFLQPVLLGTIEKEGLRWQTEDLNHFKTSMDALNYLITLRQEAVEELEQQAQAKYQERIEQNRKKNQSHSLVRTKSAIKNNRVTRAQMDSQNWSEFQEFLKFKKQRELEMQQSQAGRAASRGPKKRK